MLHVAEVEEPHADPARSASRCAPRASIRSSWKVRSGDVAPSALATPTTPGSDVADVVDEVGEGVDDVTVSDEVFGFAISSAAAEHTLLLAHYARRPRDYGIEEEASRFRRRGRTAARTLDLLGVGEGQTLLDHRRGRQHQDRRGAARAAARRARHRHGRERDHDFLRSLGAEPTTYGDGLVERVRALAPGGVDRALDTAGRGALPDLIELTGDAGNVVTIATSAREFGVRVSSGSGTERAYYALADAARYAQEGRFSLPVEQAFAFADAPEAHQVSQAGHVRGKLMLHPEVRSATLRAAGSRAVRESRRGGRRAGAAGSLDRRAGPRSIAAPPRPMARVPFIDIRDSPGSVDWERLRERGKAVIGGLQGDRGPGLPGGDLQWRARRAAVHRGGLPAIDHHYLRPRTDRARLRARPSSPS